MSDADRPNDTLRDVVLPALLAVAIMLAVWWYWRASVLDVGAQAGQAPAAGAPASENGAGR